MGLWKFYEFELLFSIALSLTDHSWADPVDRADTVTVRYWSMVHIRPGNLNDR